LSENLKEVIHRVFSAHGLHGNPSVENELYQAVTAFQGDPEGPPEAPAPEPPPPAVTEPPSPETPSPVEPATPEVAVAA